MNLRNILIKFVKEPGIAEIIIDYKNQMENQCQNCFVHLSEFWEFGYWPCIYCKKIYCMHCWTNTKHKDCGC